MRGFVLYEGRSLIGSGDVVAIATLESANDKTGDMIQVWILPADRDPLDAIHDNDNGHVCGRCPLQGTFDAIQGKMVNRVCYVNLGQAPKQVWRSYHVGCILGSIVASMPSTYAIAISVSARMAILQRCQWRWFAIWLALAVAGLATVISCFGSISVAPRRCHAI